MDRHNFAIVKNLIKISPRKSYVLQNERGQYYEGYDEHFNSHQRLKYSRIYKVNHRNKKRIRGQ